MPNHSATLKSLRKDKKLQSSNVAQKSRLRTLQKRVREAVADQDQESAQKYLKQAISALDTAAKRHLIHKNNASRRKSRLMHLVSSLGKE